MVLLSWDGKTPNEIATELGCHPQTVRIHLKRFTLEGITGLRMRPGSGRKSRLTEQERSRILALAKQEPLATSGRELVGPWWPETRRAQLTGV
jgi:transposase